MWMPTAVGTRASPRCDGVAITWARRASSGSGRRHPPPGRTGMPPSATSRLPLRSTSSRGPGRTSRESCGRRARPFARRGVLMRPAQRCVGRSTSSRRWASSEKQARSAPSWRACPRDAGSGRSDRSGARTRNAMNARSIETTLRTLRLDGRAVLPGDADWDGARSVWNGMIDRQPLGVIQAASPADVSAGIGVARDLGVPLAIRGGGHNVAGNGTVEAGLVIDLRPMHDVHVDPATRVVTVGGGATLGEMDRATIGDRIAVPAGVVSGTGVGGLTLGGGMGWLTRAHGLTIDHLLAVDLVTADGRQVTASA